MAMRMSASLSAPVKSKLVNWQPPGQARGKLWSVLKISGLPYRDSASFKASTRNRASMVFDNRQANPWRVAQSMIATRYRKPRWTGI